MSQLKRYDPFAIEPVGDVFQELLHSVRGSMDSMLPFKVDVAESDKAYSVVTEIPGAKKEDIDVAVDRGTVMISAKVERTSEEKEDERIICNERYSDTMQHMFTLNAVVDESKVGATYGNGLLRVTLPKKDASPQQHIMVRQAPGDCGMRLQFLGVTDTVTGSKYVLETGGHRVTIDCRLFQGYKSLRLRNQGKPAVNPYHIDAVVLTHAHIDHSGYLPLLVRNGFYGPVYCTKGTAELCNTLLPDSARLVQEDAQYANAEGFSHHHPVLPLYDEKDAARALRRLHPVGYGERFSVAEGVEAEFHRAEHIIGAATATLLTEGRCIVFSGDLGRQIDPIIRPPESIAEVDTLLVESTYGDCVHPAGDPLDTPERVVQRAIGRGGMLLIPAFAVGRTQELLYCLYMLIREHRIPYVSIYLDSPMAELATGVLAYHIDGLHTEATDCQVACTLAIPVQSPEQLRHLGSNRAPKTILAVSGMATDGRVLHHPKNFDGGKRNAILMSGFQAAGTRGAALLAGQRALRVHGHEVAIRASVEQAQNLSTHADTNELMTQLRSFTQPPQQTFIVHGEPAASDALCQRIEHELRWSVCMPEYHESYELEGA